MALILNMSELTMTALVNHLLKSCHLQLGEPWLPHELRHWQHSHHGPMVKAGAVSYFAGGDKNFPEVPAVGSPPQQRDSQDTLWWTNIAMENGHWNSGFSH